MTRRSIAAIVSAGEPSPRPGQTSCASSDVAGGSCAWPEGLGSLSSYDNKATHPPIRGVGFFLPRIWTGERRNPTPDDHDASLPIAPHAQPCLGGAGLRLRLYRVGRDLHGGPFRAAESAAISHGPGAASCWRAWCCWGCCGSSRPAISTSARGGNGATRWRWARCCSSAAMARWPGRSIREYQPRRADLRSMPLGIILIDWLRPGGCRAFFADRRRPRARVRGALRVDPALGLGAGHADGNVGQARARLRRAVVVGGGDLLAPRPRAGLASAADGTADDHGRRGPARHLAGAWRLERLFLRARDGAVVARLRCISSCSDRSSASRLTSGSCA